MNWGSAVFWFDKPTVTDGTFPYTREGDKCVPNPEYIEKQLTMNKEAVNHPAHYNAHPSGVEAITVCEHMNFNLGNAFKYLFRCGSKGHAREDLKKALWYLEREKSRRARPWWLRWRHYGYLFSLDAPSTVRGVVLAEVRYSGHMAAALSHVWAAHACSTTTEWLEYAVESVGKMIWMEESRNKANNKYP